jgi:outer membrane scaffolding protein for murein synthesis (MipA/OmpV family)
MIVINQLRLVSTQPRVAEAIVSRKMKRRGSVFRTIVAPIVAAMVLFPTLAIATWEVLYGRGAAVYSNVYGLNIHYTSVPIFVATLLAALGVAFAARLIYFWRNVHDGAAKLRSVQSPTASADLSDGE